MSNDANLLAFDTDLARFAKKMDIAPEVVTRRIVLDLHGRVTKRTPVDTGRARASWDVKQGSPSDYVPPEPPKGTKAAGKGKTKLGTGLAGNALGSGAKTGGKAKDISAAVAEIDGKQPVFITTALDYVQYLEQGSSKQAPVGMVLLSLAEIEVEMEEIIGQI